MHSQLAGKAAETTVRSYPAAALLLATDTDTKQIQLQNCRQSIDQSVDNAQDWNQPPGWIAFPGDNALRVVEQSDVEAPAMRWY
jgi:hypothetical protein